MSCEGENDADIENIGSIIYFPTPGFEGQYFPFKNVKGYLSPVVAVYFESPASKRPRKPPPSNRRTSPLFFRRERPHQHRMQSLGEEHPPRQGREARIRSLRADAGLGRPDAECRWGKGRGKRCVRIRVGFVFCFGAAFVVKRSSHTYSIGLEVVTV